MQLERAEVVRLEVIDLSSEEMLPYCYYPDLGGVDSSEKGSRLVRTRSTTGVLLVVPRFFDDVSRAAVSVSRGSP